MTQSKILLVLTLVIIGVFSRWLPHPANFTAVGAVALLAGSSLKNRGLALILPFIILVLSDLVLGSHALMVYVYLGFVLVTLLGFLIPDKNVFQKSQIFKISGLALSSSLMFFLVTNFGVWRSGGIYPQTEAGLIECFMMGLPFLKNQIAGDLFFSSFLFSAYELLGRRWLLTSAEAQKSLS